MSLALPLTAHLSSGCVLSACWVQLLNATIHETVPRWRVCVPAPQVGYPYFSYCLKDSFYYCGTRTSKLQTLQHDDNANVVSTLMARYRGKIVFASWSHNQQTITSEAHHHC
jgi:hypothetical protein